MPWRAPLRKILTRHRHGRYEDAESIRQLVQAAFPNDPAAQYKLLVLIVLLDAPYPHARVVAHVQDTWADKDLTAVLLGGETGPPVDGHHVEELLSWCDASPARSSVALELYATACAAAAAQPSRAKPAVRRPDPADAVSERDLLGLMRDCRVWVGEPSFEAMATAAGGRYVKSTMAQAAKGPRLPNLQVFTAYMKGCGIHGHELESWRDAWRVVKLSRPEEEN